MKGRHRVIIQNNRLHYEFDIKRNITIIQGNSATGKTTLVDMLRQHMNLGSSSGIDVRCDVPCRVLEGIDWKIILANLRGMILFIDEGNDFITTEEFAAAVKGSDNYFVIITRENLYNLPYSVEEIYGLHSSGKYQNTRRIYQQTYRIYANLQSLPLQPKKIIVEDSNSGYEFFKNICDGSDIECVSAEGKSNLFSVLKKSGKRETCLIADGAAIGPEMSALYKQAIQHDNIKLYLPESFEWIILQSGIINNASLRNVLEVPEDYVDSKEYFSWEQFFTKLLIKETEGTYLQYRKRSLNPAYLHERNKKTILSVMQGIDF